MSLSPRIAWSNSDSIALSDQQLPEKAASENHYQPASIHWGQRLWALNFEGELGRAPTEWATGRSTKIEN